MARTYRWLGGIGYILSLIPYVNIASSILVAIAWIMMGKDTRERVFTALGILLIVFFITSIIMATAILMPVLTPPLMGAIPSIPPGAFEAFFGILMVAGAVILVMAIVAFTLDIVAHFRAAQTFDNKWFKLGGWLRIGVVIALVISIPLTIINMFTTGLAVLGQPAMGLGAVLLILWSLIIVMALSLLATIFSIIGFFTIPKEAP